MFFKLSFLTILMELEVLSFNCFDSPASFGRMKRFNAVAREVLNINPDVAMFQELVYYESVSLLKDRLVGYNSFRNFKGNSKAGGLMTSTRLLIDSYEFVKYNRQASLNPLTLSDKWLGKGFQVLTLQRPRITLINTHLMSPYLDTKGEWEVIDAQLTQLAEFVKKTKGAVLVGGDFNLRPDTDHYKTFLENSGLNDPLAGSSELTFMHDQVIPIARPFAHRSSRYDYFFTRDVKNVHQRVVFKNKVKNGKSGFYLSDHRGLLTQVQV